MQRSDDEARRHAAQAVQADRALVREHALLRVVLQSTQQRYWFIDAESVTTDVNPAMCVMLGRTRESIIGLNITRFFESADLDVLLSQLAAMQDGQQGRYEIGLVRPDGTRLHCVNHGTPISDADGTAMGSVGLWIDITARHRFEQNLLTYESALNSITAIVSVVDDNLNYRMVNNAWCQATGLARAEAIGRNTRELFANVLDEARADCLRECFLSQKVSTMTGPLSVPGLVGRELETTCYPITDETGVRSVVIVTRDITSEVNLLKLTQKSEAQQRALLDKAIQLQQFVLHYQPQVEPDGRVAGAEALIRWQHSQRGMVPPVEFIGLAEEIGLILPIGTWVLETACQQLAVWADVPGMEDLSLAVNVSANQLHQPDFVGQVIAALDRTGAQPHRLKLGLTESIMVADIKDVIAKMTVLSGMGVGFSLDDFGTGYSSLSYLGRLPLHQLKIDRSFVKNIEISDDAVVICGATISLAHSLKLKVVTEGIETEAQRYFLSRVHGCDYIQGYLYSKPLPLQEYEHYVMASGKQTAKPGRGKSK